MITRKDLTATALTALAVLTYAATYQGWGVPLVGDSRRWTTGAILLLGMLACGQGAGAKVKGTALTPFAVLGTLAFVFAVVAFWTASLTWVSLLTRGRRRALGGVHAAPRLAPAAAADRRLREPARKLSAW